MKKRVLYILAPNDRFNYGDLLFTYSIIHCIGDKFDQIRHISTSQSDLSKLGGVPTESYKVLYKLDEQCDNFLIVAGGESLFAKWGTVIAFVDAKYHNFAEGLKRIFWFRKKTATSIHKRIVKLLIHPKTVYPFTIGRNELQAFKAVYYNAVGASRLNSKAGERLLSKQKNQNILRSVDAISVRDIDTHTALNKAKIENKLVADSAILLSDIFPAGKIEELLSIDTQATQSPYIYFQGNRLYLEQFGKEIAEQLSTLQKSSNLRVCLSPIGTALGHEDDLGIEHLKPLLDELEVDYFEIRNPNIYDIMWLIGEAKLYIGSSLHGIITAMSYNTPYMGYLKQKLESYINTWGDGKQFAKEISSICDIAHYAMQTPCDNSLLIKQKESIIKSLNEIAASSLGENNS